MELFELLNTANSWIYILAGALVLALGAFFGYRSINKTNRFTKQILALETEMLDIKAIPVSQRLAKLAAVGENNVVFASVYQEYSKLYDETHELYSKEIGIELDDAKTKLKNKEFFKISPILKGLAIKIDSFKERIIQIEDALKEIMKDEDETRLLEEKVKAQLHECKELLKHHELEVEVCLEEFIIEFKKIDEQLAIYSDTVKSGSYNDAKDILEKVLIDISKIKEIIENNYSIISEISIKIPARLNELIDLYNDMQNQGYPLYHISGIATINSVKDSVFNAIEFLKAFNFENMSDVIAHLNLKLDVLYNALETEQKARLNFEANFKISYDRAELLENEHIRHIKEVAELEKYYILDEKILEKTKTIKKAISSLSNVRRILDNLTYGNQAYSSRIDRLNEMIEQVNIVETGIKEFKEGVRKLSDISELAYTLLEAAAFKLKNAQFKLRETHHQKLNDKFIEKFNHVYNLIEKLGGQISKMPMDIGKIDNYTTEINKNLVAIISAVDEDVSNFNKARKLLMYANAYRSSFTDVARNLTKAETLYFDANFVQAIDVTLEATSRFAIPDSLLAEFDIATPSQGDL
jgi:septation ring formation regulator